MKNKAGKLKKCKTGKVIYSRKENNRIYLTKVNRPTTPSGISMGQSKISIKLSKTFNRAS